MIFCICRVTGVDVKLDLYDSLCVLCDKLPTSRVHKCAIPCDMQVHVVKSCYIVPHVGGHAKVHAARACPSYHGRPVFSDLAVQGLEVDAATGLDVNTIWYGRAILFFRAFEKVQEWDEDKQRQVPKSKPHELVFLRWYRVTGYTDVAHCRILEWECSRGQQPSVQVRSIESLIGVEMMLPKTSATHGKELWYQNKYLKL